MNVVKEIWGKLSRKERVRFIITTMIAILWPIYAATDYPKPPAAIQFGLWGNTGTIVARLTIAIAIIASNHNDRKESQC